MTMEKTFDKTLALLAPHYDYCGGKGGSWIPAHWDSGHPDSWSECRGCAGCMPAIALASFFAAFPYANALAGFAALAAIGKAVKAAAAPARGFSTMVARATAHWNGPPVKGAWYEVTAKRGSAKAHFGVVGECFWIREEGYTKYGRTTYSTRVGLKPAGSTEAVFVPAGCVTRVAPPAAALPVIAAKEAAAAERAARTPYAAARGDVVSVVHGANAGKFGRVFWVGSTKHGARYGLDPEVNRKRGRCASPLWVDAVDCGPFAAPAKSVAAAPAKIPAAPAKTYANPASIATAKAVLDHATPPAPEATCRGIHCKGDGSYWVSDAKGIPVARVCDKCKATKLAKYRPEIFTNPSYVTNEAI